MLNRLLGVNDKEDGPPLTLEDACELDSRKNYDSILEGGETVV